MGLDLLTRQRRLVFQPLEELRVTTLGALVDEVVTVDDDLDRRFKPGLLEQVRGFLSGNRTHACMLADQVELLPVYEKIAGYR